jgi:hypothetical protein
MRSKFVLSTTAVHFAISAANRAAIVPASRVWLRFRQRGAVRQWRVLAERVRVLRSRGPRSCPAERVGRRVPARTAGVFAGIIEIGAVGLCVIKLMELMRRRLLVWHQETLREETTM